MILHYINRLARSFNARYLFSQKKSQEQLAYNQHRLATLQTFSISFLHRLSPSQADYLHNPFPPKIQINQITTKPAVNSCWPHHFSEETRQNYVHWYQIVAYPFANCSPRRKRWAFISQGRRYWSNWSGFCHKKGRIIVISCKEIGYMGGQSLPLDAAWVQLTQR